MGIEIKDDTEPTAVQVPKEMVEAIQGDEHSDPFAPEAETAPVTVTSDTSSPTEDTELIRVKTELTALKAALNAKGNTQDSFNVSKIVAEAVAEALRTAIPAAAVGIAKAQSEANTASLEEKVRQAQKKLRRCGICNLPESACGGAYAMDAKGNPLNVDKDGAPIIDPKLNHVRAYVGPRDEELFQWFQGVIIRNVRFLSDFPGHMIWIPKKSDILTIVNNWERNEKELSRRRRGEGKGMQTRYGSERNSGYQGALGWR